MKSGPTLNACTRRPRAVRAAKSASVTVVLPTPLEVPAMIKRGLLIYPVSSLIGEFYTAENRPDRGAKCQNLFVTLVEEVIDSPIDLPLISHIIRGGYIDY